MNYITQETAAKIWKCYREIEAAETLIKDINSALKENDYNPKLPILKDAFGRKRHLELGTPSGSNSTRIFGVAPELGISIIKAHIANQKAQLAEYNEIAKVELMVSVHDSDCEMVTSGAPVCTCGAAERKD